MRAAGVPLPDVSFVALRPSRNSASHGIATSTQQQRVWAVCCTARAAPLRLHLPPCRRGPPQASNEAREQLRMLHRAVTGSAYSSHISSSKGQEACGAPSGWVAADVPRPSLAQSALPSDDDVAPWHPLPAPAVHPKQWLSTATRWPAAGEHAGREVSSAPTPPPCHTALVPLSAPSPAPQAHPSGPPGSPGRTRCGGEGCQAQQQGEATPAPAAG